MQRFVVTCALLLAGVAAAGCGPDPEVAAEKAREEQWQQIDQNHQELTAKRDQLAAACQAAAGDGGGAATDGGGAAADLEALETEATKLADDLYQRLVEFINANPPVAGETPPERVRQAIRMKSDEDIRIAQGWIDEGGDYRRAIDIYDGALASDPDYEELKNQRAEAEAMRFMTEERFAQVEDGMTRDEVRALLGQVNLRNIRDYAEKNAVAWFYPRDEQGSAAAVWFNQNRQGEYVVYELDFHFKDAGEAAAEDG
jgi:outer membrane murein-binding lipoprotein Lpp